LRPMNVLITDGENRSALAVTRSLGRKGCSVVVTGMDTRTLASSSRFCRRGVCAPDPLRQGEEYVSAVGEIAVRESIDVIFPVTEQSIHLLSGARHRLPKDVILACPPSEKMRAISDKSALFRLAESLGVPIPRTLYLDTPGELSSVSREIEHYPVVVKPALSKIPLAEGFLSTGVRYASSREELERLYETSEALRYPSMIQERIVGVGTGLFTLYGSAGHLALFSHRRLREKPPSGGVSVLSESVPLDQEMVEASGRLLSAVGWDGVAMVEFKRDQRDGRAKLMEINGRFWGSLQLAIACGVDFPGLLLDHLMGKRPQHEIGNYLVGHKLKWFLGTLDHLLIRLRNSRERLNLSADAPSKVRALAEFLMIWERNTSFDVNDRNDFAPFCYELYSYLRQIRGK
jgi:predicted ATP-grasp superfamily ATP-dependent carboligase